MIVSTSPFIRPVDFGIPLDTIDPDLRQVRNVKMPWERSRRRRSIRCGSRAIAFFCCTPKSRHSTHSSWSTVDWHWIWSDNFGDPHRTDKRAPGVADRQIQMNPQAAEDLGLNEGDYVYVDANELDRPYIGWKDDTGPRHKAFRCLVRVKFNPGLALQLHDHEAHRLDRHRALGQGPRDRGPTAGHWPPRPATRPATATARTRASPATG